MPRKSAFAGFPKEIIGFYRSLGRNNSRHWFEKHRDDYERFVMEPARHFITEIGTALLKLSPGIRAEPRVDRSIFRIHRDTRFSRDKSPYKTNLALWLWEGNGPRMECSGYYFHLEADSFMLGAGIYMFPPHLLKAYRESVVHKTDGPALADAVAMVAGKGKYGIGGRHYKRVPRGYDPGHANAELLLHNGLYAGTEGPVPGEIFTSDCIDYCMARYRDMAPLHRWLYTLTERVS